MRMCARTSKIKRTNTERKFTQERKVGHRGCVVLGNVVALRRKWQEALQMIQPSECKWPRVLGRLRGVLRGISNRSHIAGREKTGRVAKTVEEQREATKSGGLVQGRKDAACRQGCRIAGSLGGRRRALIDSSDHRAAHVSCDGPPSSKMSVGVVRM
jgi:hypothetical protein